jgi:hypothetical protein
MDRRSRGTSCSSDHDCPEAGRIDSKGSRSRPGAFCAPAAVLAESVDSHTAQPTKSRHSLPAPDVHSSCFWRDEGTIVGRLFAGSAISASPWVWTHPSRCRADLRKSALTNSRDRGSGGLRSGRRKAQAIASRLRLSVHAPPRLMPHSCAAHWRVVWPQG